MALKLMYITNRPDIACIAENAGIDWIFIDMEYIGKTERQGGLDTVKNHHTIEDIRRVKKNLKKSEVLVRINPIHDIQADGYFDSEHEIDAVVEAGADIIMLPYFHSVREVETFINYVRRSNLKNSKSVRTCLLLETPEAALLIDEILNIGGIDMVHIGLNDLHLAMGMKFMFQLLSEGIVDQLASKIKAKGIPFGFGGMAGVSGGSLPGSYILKEHYRLGSSMVIIGRSFCNTDLVKDLEQVKKIFQCGIKEIRELEAEAQEIVDYFIINHKQVIDKVDTIVETKSN